MPINIVNPLSSGGSLEAEIQDSQGSKIPDKYQGKSLEDVVNMHAEAERALSRQGQTVGEQRKIIDKFLELQLQEKVTKQPEVKQPLTTDALFENPESAINSRIEAEVGSRVKKLESQVTGVHLQMQQRDFETRHPDVKEVVSDPEFQKWVQDSQYRMGMAQRLGQYDFNAGEELLGFWKDYKEVQGVKNKKEDAQTRRQQALQAARTEGQGAGADTSPKKIYNRVDVSNLRIRAMTGDKEAAKEFNDPDFQARLRQAYAEGRVR